MQIMGAGNCSHDFLFQVKRFESLTGQEMGAALNNADILGIYFAQAQRYAHSCGKP
jgi:hypothetical protein